MTEFATELDWMKRRAEIEDTGFIIHDGKKYNMLYLDGTNQEMGFDAYIAPTGEVLCTRWQREKLFAGRVIEEYSSHEDMDEGIDGWIQWLLKERKEVS